MSDYVILLSGLFCFSLALVGLILTVLEFRRMAARASALPVRDSVLRAEPRVAVRR